ncbi:MAG: hypothetical protein BVN35_22220 [Proteobacteria bacterium ST_bin11]|nr:MAG: hypothetical protein BVN35_22220 [Proteobacteria bacterium ST_bin11]
MINSTYHHDALQSVLGQSAHDGQIQATQSYTAFGGNLSSTGTSNAAQKYTGREDDGNGCLYYRARYYCTGLDRFISEDPLGFAAGINFYAYVGNNPVNGNDPSGMLVCATVCGLMHDMTIQDAMNVGAMGNAALATSGANAGLALAGAGGAYAASGLSLPALTASQANIALGAGIGGTAAVVGAYSGNPNTTFDQALKAFGAGAAIGGFSASVSIGGSLSSAVLRNTIAGAGGNAFGQAFTGGIENIAPAQVMTQGLIGGLSGGVGNSVGLFQSLNYARVGFSATDSVALGGIGGTSAGIATSTLINALVPSSLGGYSGLSSANGGFVLYPNKSNTNQLKSVYSK